ncbi:MAG: phage minor head protein [Telluria sp.]
MAANDELLDAAIAHQIALQRYSTGVVRRMIAVLNRSDQRLFAELVAALERLDPASFTVQRLESMLGSVRAINAQAYARVGDDLRKELRDFTDYEASYQQMALASVLPTQLSVAAVVPEQVYAAAMARPFQGVILQGALDDLSAGKAKKIRQAIAQGFVEGKTSSQIVRELRGTRALKYADGLLEIDRRHLQTIVQTAISHTAGFVQDRHYAANADLLKGVSWSAKLDLRTSSACRIRDGKMWDMKHKPVGHSLPWGAGPGAYHYNCRSSAAPVLKSFKELMGVDVDESKFPVGSRASLDGQLPANQTYNEWLTKQSAMRQDSVLGPTRGKLLREGKLPIDQMYTPKGDYLSLKQLRELDASTFSRAGL